VRLQLERADVVVKRALGLQRVCKRGAEFVPEPVVVRPQLERRLEIGGGFLVLVAQVVEHPQNGPHVGVARSEPQSSLEKGCKARVSSEGVGPFRAAGGILESGVSRWSYGARFTSHCGRGILGAELLELGVRLQPAAEVAQRSALVELIGEADAEKEQGLEVERIRRHGVLEGDDGPRVVIAVGQELAEGQPGR